MEIQILQFDERVGLGTFSGWLQEQQWTVRCWRCDQQELPPVAGQGPVLLLGGYMGVHEQERHPYLQHAAEWLAVVASTGTPILAICLGGQLLAHALGGQVHSQRRQEKGICHIELTEAGCSDPLFAGLPDPFVSFEWHNDSFDLPEGAALLARTEACPGQAFRYQNAWGVQFHPEVDEQIVTDWSQRTNAGEGPLINFHQHKLPYFGHSKKMLQNFLLFSQTVSTQFSVKSLPPLDIICND